jgi:dephospho-CoA kinase
VTQVIALTGGVATGKSRVAAMLVRRGAALVDSDLVAREVVEPGTPGLAAVVEAFGPGVLNAQRGLDRDRLGALVFADPVQRRRLEAIVHPLIRARTRALVDRAVSAGGLLVVVDIPLLYETGGEGRFPDGVLLVYADRATQLRRLTELRGLDPEAAGRMLAAQLPIDVKLPRATWVIDNRGTPEASEAQVERWWRRVVGAAAGFGLD